MERNRRCKLITAEPCQARRRLLGELETLALKTLPRVECRASS